MKNNYSKLILLLTLALPAFTYAFPGNLTGVVGTLFDYFNIIIPILNGLAFLVFFWGVAKFILSAGDTKALADGRKFMIWGIVGLFVLVSFWGIMSFLSSQFGFSGTVKFQFLPTT